MQNAVEIYTANDGTTHIDVRFDNQTVWLSQAQMGELFGRNQSVISRHINNAVEEGEIEEKSNMQKMHIANSDRPVVFYDLETIISVGYRVKSSQGVAFRRWATQRLKDYLIQGYAINQQRLKENRQQFLQTLEDLKALTHNNPNIETNEILSLIQKFSDTWFTLDSYDKNAFPEQGNSQSIETSSEALQGIWRY
ncbi:MULTISPECIES: virulence RhuM family protein [unclassified Moraxella]|uniref:virulence RhuM family protein n=1 Tax=unclassified Moraxella TaxID=2685852 RepID=UPI003AF9AA1B